MVTITLYYHVGLMAVLATYLGFILLKSIIEIIPL